MDYKMLVEIPITDVPDNVSIQEAKVTAGIWLKQKIKDAAMLEFWQEGKGGKEMGNRDGINEAYEACMADIQPTFGGKKMIERVKKILEEPEVSGYDWEIGKTILASWKASLPERICQQFPKSADNPDGYEPKSDDRLLLPVEIGNLPLGVQTEHRKPVLKEGFDPASEIFTVVAKVQLAKIACLKDAEWKEKMDALMKRMGNQCQQKGEKIRQELMAIDCMKDIADVRKAITSLVYSLKSGKG